MAASRTASSKRSFPINSPRRPSRFVSTFLQMQGGSSLRLREALLDAVSLLLSVLAVILLPLVTFLCPDTRRELHLRHLMGANLLLVSVTSVFHARHCLGLERVPSSINSATLFQSAPSMLDNPCRSPDARPTSLSVLRVQMPRYPRSGFFPDVAGLSAHKSLCTFFAL
jgi:hypothetical protein